jgi:hypothetical protein
MIDDETQPIPEAEAPSWEGPVLLEPRTPAPGSKITVAPGGVLGFAWSADEETLRSLHAGQKLRVDFCMRVAGETSGYFIMQTVSPAARELTLTFAEIRAKLGPAHAKAERVRVRWQLSLSVANSGPFFTSREAEFQLLSPPKAPRETGPDGRPTRRRLFASGAPRPPR